MSLQRRLPGALLALGVIWLALAALPPRRRTPDFEAFGRLPVLHNGRLKPLDSLARVSLLMLHGKQSVVIEGRRVGALEWLLDVLARPERADAAKVFVIDDPDVLGLLGRERPREKHFSFAELSPALAEIEAQAARAEPVEPQARTRFQSSVVNLRERLVVYQRLKNTLQPEGAEDFPAQLEAYEASILPGLRALKDHQRSAAFNREALAALNDHFERFQFLSEAAYFYPLPPAVGDSPEDWTSVGAGLLQALRGAWTHPGIVAYASMLKAWRASDAAAFDSALAAYRKDLDVEHPRPAAWAGYEALLNRLDPFAKGMALYLLVFLLAVLSWLAWPATLQRSAYFLLLLAFAVHTGGLLSRMLLEGRPPVTNLYSSAIFVGWAAVAAALWIERLTRRGFGSVVASGIGFTTLIIAHHLTGSGDTMEMMRAVLDSNFWLATHVVTITIGYSGTFLAGALAHVYILRGALTPSLDKETAGSLTKMTYAVVCFSLFFSFVGTVLGGIWADQSWGRFWGWDPKENGALLIVLWNAIILHARWGGYIRERGLMVMAVFGDIVTSLSWFGVNMLGIGLHSYGFMDKAFYALSAFILTQLAVMALAGLPFPRWRSYPSLPASA